MANIITKLYPNVSENEVKTLWNKGLNVETVAEFVTQKHQESLDKEKEERRLSLLEIIARQEAKETVNQDIPLNSKQMWNGNEWVPLCLSKAHSLIKNDKDFDLQIRMFTQCTNQSQFGTLLYGWRTIDSDYLKDGLERLSDLDSISCSCCVSTQLTATEFRDMVRGDKATSVRDGYPYDRGATMRKAI